MGDKWFRGEAAGVAPAKPGGHLHDLGDGLYLTDTEDVAWMYAKARTSDHADYRIWELSVDRSTLGKVLDLTTDSRWVKFITKNEPMLLNKSREFYIRRQNELYSQYFNEFLKNHNIDIAQYDAVIGPEYVRGGKQLCILSNKGRGERLQARVRSLLRPEKWAARLASVSARLKLTPEQRAAFVKQASAKVIMFGIGLLFDYLESLALQHFNERILRERLSPLEGETSAFLSVRQRMLLDFCLEQKTYVQAVVRLAYVYNYQEDETGGAMGGLVTTGGILAEVKLDSLMLSHNNFNGRTPGQPQVNREYTGPVIYRTGYIEYDLQTFSSEVAPDKAVLDVYRSMMEKSKWYDQTLKDPAIFDQDRERLKRERAELWDYLDATFGKIGDFTPSPSLWTNEGLARMRGS